MEQSSEKLEGEDSLAAQFDEHFAAAQKAVARFHEELKEASLPHEVGLSLEDSENKPLRAFRLV